MTDAAQLLLSGLLSTHNSEQESQIRFNYTSSRLDPDFFEDKKEQAIYQISSRYFMQTGLQMLPNIFSAVIDGATALEPAEKIEYKSLFDDLSADEKYLSPGRFTHVVTLFVDEVKTRRFAEVLVNASQIMQVGKTIGGKILFGIEEAQQYLNDQQLKIERLSSSGLPRGFMHEAAPSLLADYLQVRAGMKKTDGVMTGIKQIDDATHGLYPGDLWIVGGYTGEGKSKIAMNVAWAAAYQQGKNVAYCTIEQLKPQVERSIACRHSHLPQFGLPGGLASNDIKFGSLSPAHQEVYQAVLKDMTEGVQEGRHGKLFIFQVSGRSQLPLVEAELKWLQTRMHIDIVIIDYLRLLVPGGRSSGNQREDLTNVIIAMKAFARDFNEGRGVPVLTPWQISREAWERATQVGKYTKSAFSDTSEAEKSSDVLWTVLKKTEQELTCQLVKNRDGQEIEPFSLHADFRSSLVAASISNEDLIS